jgi:2-polyprenyl-3-methyl-5-hydroxy-6-metoxy-1,4-benzoquinol methylase
MVRPGGEVVAADIQPEMLAMLQAEIEKRALQDWIRPHRQPGEEDIGLSDPFDVILGFYMLHEVADKTAYLAQISDLLKPGGIFILVEPNFVLRTEEFTQEVVLVREAGLAPIKRPRIFLSRSVVFQAPEDLPGD